MNRLLITCGILLFGLMSHNLLACSCAGESTVEGEFKSSDIVLSGKVINSINEWVPDSSEIKYMTEFGISIDSLDKRLIGQYFRKVQILIETLYKGKVNNDTLTIYTGMGGGDCGYHFNVGQKYILYADSDSYFASFNKDQEFPDGENIYWTNICSRTQEYNRKEANTLEKLKK